MNYQSQSVIEENSKRKLSALLVIGLCIEQVYGNWSGEENERKRLKFRRVSG